MPTKLYTWKRKSKSEYAKDIKEYNALTPKQKAFTKQPTTMKQQALKRGEVKQYIMKVNNWTSSQYRKQYDIFKNKLRAYESYQKARGANIEKQSVVEVLYKEARSKALYGPSYKPSQKMKQIRSFSAYSITKGRQKATQESYLKKQDINYDKYIKKQFGGFLEKNEGAKAIYDAFKERGLTDYTKLEKALSDYASDVAFNIKAQMSNDEGEAIYSGEVYGSDETADFDIDNYL